jgi:hypothetical protein
MRRLMAYHEAIGAYARAEDVLYFLRDSGEDDWDDTARQFYHRLQARSDRELSDGGLSRAELAEGVEELNSGSAEGRTR